MGVIMEVEEFLSRLEGVKPVDKDHWIARCPHHNDRLPSLAIARGDHVPILLHCFAGCDVDEVVGAVGLDLADLMPERQSDEDTHRTRLRTPFSPVQALRCLETEARFLFIIAADMVAGKPLDELTKDRLIQAAARIGEARRACHA